MADTFIDLAGGAAVPFAENPPRIKFPFRNNPLRPDIWARTIERDRSILTSLYEANGRLSIRTSYTNYLLQSNAFAATWSLSNFTQTPNIIANPWDGTADVTQLLETVTNGLHYIVQGFVTAAVPTTVSLLAWSGSTRGWIKMEVYDGTTFFTCFFNIATGVASTPAALTTASITPFGIGWYRCSITFTPAAFATTNLAVYSSTDGSTLSYTGSTSAALYITAVQAVRSSVGGPRISTTTATRAVNVPDVDAVVNSSLSANNLLDWEAFLCAESDPSPRDPLLATFSQMYARIPATQRVPSSKWISRPNLDGVYVSGSAWAVSFDDLKRFTHIFTSRKTIASIAALANTTVATTGTVVASGTIVGTGTIGGTGTVAGQAQAFSPDGLPTTTVTIHSDFPNTGTFPANSNWATIQGVLTSLNIKAAIVVSNRGFSISDLGTGTQKLVGIDCVDSTVEVSGSGGAYTLTRTQTTAYADVTDTRATLDTRATTDTVGTTDTHSLTQTYLPGVSVRACTTTANHGAAVGDFVAFFQGDRIVARSIVITQDGSTGFTVLMDDVSGANFAAATVVFSSGAYKCVVNGSIEADTEEVTEFFLPYFSILASGATMGPYTDWPVQVVQMDAVSWLTALIAYFAAPTVAIWAIESVQGKKPYAGAILSYGYTRVSLPDAVDTVAV